MDFSLDRYSFGDTGFLGANKGWAYQDFAAGAIVGTAVTLSANENGDYISFSSSHVINGTAVIVRSDDPTKRVYTGATAILSSVVTVSAHTGASITLSGIPHASYPVRIYYAYNYTAGIPVNYSIPPKAVKSVLFSELETMLVTEQELTGGTKAANFLSLTIADAGYIGSTSAPTAIQIEADGDVVFISDVTITDDLTVDTIFSTENAQCAIDMTALTDVIGFSPGYGVGDNSIVFKSTDATAASPQIYPSTDGEGQLGLAATNRWNSLALSGNLIAGDGTFTGDIFCDDITLTDAIGQDYAFGRRADEVLTCTAGTSYFAFEMYPTGENNSFFTLWLDAHTGTGGLANGRYVQFKADNTYEEMEIVSGQTGGTVLPLVINVNAAQRAVFHTDGDIEIKSGDLNFTKAMGNGSDDPTTDAPTDWVEVQIGGVTRYLPAYT